MNKIEKYYNKFNEDKRLNTRHGIVEFEVSMWEIKKLINNTDKIIDIGAGTGKYSIELFNAGYDVTAVELVKKNLSVLQGKNSQIKSYLGNAINLKKFKDNSFDVVILFGPMYHLFSMEDKKQALMEAKRISKVGGIIFVAYVMNEYAFIRHAIMDGHLRESIESEKISKDFHVITSEDDLYSFSRLEDIDELNKSCGLKRIKIFAPDGATDYIRPYINKLSEKDFATYIEYQKANAERPELLGASSHIVDVLQVEK